MGGNLGRVELGSTNFISAAKHKQRSYGHVMAVHSALTPLYPVRRLQDSLAAYQVGVDEWRCISVATDLRTRYSLLQNAIFFR